MTKTGGDRAKPETLAPGQVWKRKDGSHFVIGRDAGLSVELKRLYETQSIETRRKAVLKSSTVRHKSYALLGHLPRCTYCKQRPGIRFGRINGVLNYSVTCECLEFDGLDPDLPKALRMWKGNARVIEPVRALHKRPPVIAVP